MKRREQSKPNTPLPLPERRREAGRPGRGRYFAGAFCVSLIVILAFCGFAAVELSTDYYMPGQFAPLLQVNYINGDGLSITCMGKEYAVSGETVRGTDEFLLGVRGYVPLSVRWASLAVARGSIALEEYLQEQEAVERESWDWS